MRLPPSDHAEATLRRLRELAEEDTALSDMLHAAFKAGAYCERSRDHARDGRLDAAALARKDANGCVARARIAMAARKENIA